MKKPVNTVPTGSSPGVRFRHEITSAIESGASADALLLKLTLMDSSKLKRDPQIAMDEISFSDGEMRYLGVKVKQGGVVASQLGALADEPPEVEPEAPAPKPKRKAPARASTAATKTKAKSKAAAPATSEAAG